MQLWNPFSKTARLEKARRRIAEKREVVVTQCRDKEAEIRRALAELKVCRSSVLRAALSERLNSLARELDSLTRIRQALTEQLDGVEVVVSRREETDVMTWPELSETEIDATAAAYEDAVERNAGRRTAIADLEAMATGETKRMESAPHQLDPMTSWIGIAAPADGGISAATRARLAALGIEE